MAWLKTLAETYDVYGHLAGVDKNEQAVLLPVSHSTFNAQIEVALDLDGNFQNSQKLEREMVRLRLFQLQRILLPEAVELHPIRYVINSVT